MTSADRATDTRRGSWAAGDDGASRGTPSSLAPAAAELDAFGAHWSLGLLVEAVEEYAIFSLDPRGVVQTWNRGARRIKGYDEHEILGRHFSVFYLPRDSEAGLPDHALAHARTHGHWSGEGWRVRKDGSVFWANVVLTAVLDDRGDLDGFVKVTRDETARRKAEENSRRLDLAAERERIALELSDSTVRDIFAATLVLDSALSITTHPRVAERIQEAMSTLDRTLVHIRNTVTDLRNASDRSGSSQTPAAAAENQPDAP